MYQALHHTVGKSSIYRPTTRPSVSIIQRPSISNLPAFPISSVPCLCLCLCLYLFFLSPVRLGAKPTSQSNNVKAEHGKARQGESRYHICYYSYYTACERVIQAART